MLNFGTSKPGIQGGGEFVPHLFFFCFSKKILEDMIPFSGANDAHILDFW